MAFGKKTDYYMELDKINSNIAERLSGEDKKRWQAAYDVISSQFLSTSASKQMDEFIDLLNASYRSLMTGMAQMSDFLETAGTVAMCLKMPGGGTPSQKILEDLKRKLEASPMAADEDCATLTASIVKLYNLISDPKKKAALHPKDLTSISHLMDYLEYGSLIEAAGIIDNLAFAIDHKKYKEPMLDLFRETEANTPDILKKKLQEIDALVASRTGSIAAPQREMAQLQREIASFERKLDELAEDDSRIGEYRNMKKKLDAHKAQVASRQQIIANHTTMISNLDKLKAVIEGILSVKSDKATLRRILKEINAVDLSDARAVVQLLKSLETIAPAEIPTSETAGAASVSLTPEEEAERAERAARVAARRQAEFAAARIGAAPLPGLDEAAAPTATGDSELPKKS